MIRLEPYTRKKPIDGWNSQLVSQLILEMKQAKEPLSIRSLHLGRKSAPHSLLSKVAGRPISKKQLHVMACHYFGTWNQALKSNGLRTTTPAFNRFWSRKLIVDCIRHLRRIGHPLTVSSIWRDHTKATSKLLIEPTGRWTTGAGLYNAACRFFESWDQALKWSGIQVHDIKEKPFWTKKKIKIAIRGLHQARIPLNAGALQFDRSTDTSNVIKIHIGKSRTGRSLIGAAYRTFGSWDRALRESGLKPSKFRKRVFRWEKRSIAKVLKTLYRSNIGLNAGSFGHDKEDVTKQIILKASGRSIQGRSLYQVGRKHHGSWDHGLRYSGLSPVTIRKRGAVCEPRKDQIIIFIQSLYISKCALNSTSMRNYSKQIQIFLDAQFGQAVSGLSVMNMAKKLFGSWDQALWEAGLNPNEIRKRSPAHTTNLPVVLHQLEDTKVDGERRKVKYLGAPPKSPFEILEEREASATLKSAVEEMNEDDQELTEKIFAAILEIHHYRDQKQLIQYVTRWLGGKVSEEKVAAIFVQLSKNVRKALH